MSLNVSRHAEATRRITLEMTGVMDTWPRSECVWEKMFETTTTTTRARLRFRFVREHMFADCDCWLAEKAVLILFKQVS